MPEVFTIAHLDDESSWACSVKRNLAEIGTKSRTNIELIQADNLEFFLY